MIKGKASMTTVAHILAFQPSGSLCGVHYRAESAGLSLKKLATFMVDESRTQCTYNLNGGGSPTMVYEKIW